MIEATTLRRKNKNNDKVIETARTLRNLRLLKRELAFWLLSASF